MISWDTNFLVRYIITDDDPAQSEIVIANLEKQQAKDHPVLITLIVLCETAWVLSKAYEFKKTQLVSILTDLIGDTNFSFENPLIFEKALERYASSKGDFSDYVIGIAARETLRAQTTHTFDKQLAKSELFTVHQARRA